MKRTLLTFLAAAALSLTGCMGYYVPKAASDSDEVQTKVAASLSAKAARISASEAGAAADEAAWKQAQSDYLAKLEQESPTRAAWFKKVLADPRVTFGMYEQEVHLLVPHAKVGGIAKSISGAKDAPIETVWSGVALPGPNTPAANGDYKGTLKVTFVAGKVTKVEGEEAFPKG